MKNSLLDHIIASLQSAKKYNSSQMIAPQVILWPDPEKQLLQVIGRLRNEIEAFITLGDYHPEVFQGPSIWIKCMIDKALHEANWDRDTIPVIYLPGVGKADFKNIEEAPEFIQPLMEYQFTGNIWTQENGRDWTILSFLQNADIGMGLNVSQDKDTKEALVKSLPKYLEDPDITYPTSIDAEFLNKLMFPQVIPTLLRWMEEGDEALAIYPLDQQEAFKDVIKSTYQVSLDYSLILDFVRQMGTKRNPWDQVWHYFANAPGKYPKILHFLRDAKSDDMGSGFFSVPEDSWPQVNEEKEELLRTSIQELEGVPAEKALAIIKKLFTDHKDRLSWIWAEIDHSPYIIALPEMIKLADLSLKAYDTGSIESLKDYYVDEGLLIDRALRQLYYIDYNPQYLASIQIVIDIFYRPWLEKLTERFQAMVGENSDFFNRELEGNDGSSFILFVDAFRYDIAQDFVEQLSTEKYEVSMHTHWSAIPSLTPTSKPSVAPIQNRLNKKSEWNEFQVQLDNGNFLSHHHFKGALSEQGFQYIASAKEIGDINEKYWMEIGDIDTQGHNEQEAMFRRIPELLNSLNHTIESIVAKGVKSILIVTDHGWLLLPGGLPKSSLHKDLVESRWGRCALIKEGVETKLMHLPWTWNPQTYIAYAPGISFFKRNESYAHGGISIHECLTPVISIHPKTTYTVSKGEIQNIEWRGMRLYVETSGANEQFKIDIRTKSSDSSSSIIYSHSLKNKDLWNVVVNSDFEGHAATLILINENGIIVDKKSIQVGH